MLRGPVFIVGSPRSGTSILVDALLSLGYSGFREGNFLPVLQSITEVIDRHFASYDIGNPKVMIAHIDPADLKRRISEVFCNITNDLQDKSPWFDKSGNPAMILGAPTLQALWPSAVFIFAKRRGIENIISRTIKFPSHPFAHHCKDWARNMSSWRSVRGLLHDGSFLEIDQLDMIRKPSETALGLSSFLGASPGDAAGPAKTLTNKRPQQTEAGSAERIRSLSSSGWSEEQITVFMQHCRDEMSAYGYSFDDGYYSTVSVPQAAPIPERP
jgi:hypothetical protein